MKLWLISQEINSEYDTYDSAVVLAETGDEAQKIHPGGSPNGWVNTWAIPEHVSVKYIGEAIEGLESENGVVCASFNAG